MPNQSPWERRRGGKEGGLDGVFQQLKHPAGGVGFKKQQKEGKKKTRKGKKTMDSQSQTKKGNK